jgi:probable rRNA maturation factor
MSAEYIHRHCLKEGIDVEKHFDVIIIHGITHLVGYDHETMDQYREMKLMEEQILKEISV